MVVVPVAALDAVEGSVAVRHTSHRGDPTLDDNGEIHTCTKSGE